ncbi:MAG: Druantia anti-phage system protein DruA [Gammaproteobacteria bacterium]
MVRPIVPAERVRWDALMRAHHYLGVQVLVGHSLRYVAVGGDEWLALLGWQAAALKCTARDRWIGWPPVLQHQRLPLIANNARFLILPDVRVPNLASRVLSLTLKRLSQDWRRCTAIRWCWQRPSSTARVIPGPATARLTGWSWA